MHFPRERLVTMLRRRARGAVGQASNSFKSGRCYRSESGWLNGARPDNGGHMETAPRRATNADIIPRSKLLSLKTRTCPWDCQVRRISSNCGRRRQGLLPAHRLQTHANSSILQSNTLGHTGGKDHTSLRCLRIVGRPRSMRIDLHELGKGHSAPNAQQVKQPQHQITTVNRSNHESMC